MGRAKTTGRYSSRTMLERDVWYFWTESQMNMAQIGRLCGVSQPTVSAILDGPKPEPRRFLKVKD